MKIVMPVDENNVETSICPSFGRAPYFMIYNTETKNSEFINNSASSSQGGAGIKAAQTIVNSGCQVVITMRCGENAAQVLHGNQIKIYKALHFTAKENLEAFEKETLPLLDQIHPGFHGNR